MIPDNVTTLSAEKMVDVAITFQESLTHVLTCYTQSEDLPKIIEYLAQLATSYQPVRAASEDGRQRLADEIFSSAALGNFFTRLTSVFYTRMGSDNEVEALNGNIARGVAIFRPELGRSNSPGDPVKYELVPREISQRTSPAEELRRFLSQNGWMVSVLLVCSYINPLQLQARK